MGDSSKKAVPSSVHDPEGVAAITGEDELEGRPDLQPGSLELKGGHDKVPEQGPPFAAAAQERAKGVREGQQADLKAATGDTLYPAAGTSEPDRPQGDSSFASEQGAGQGDKANVGHVLQSDTPPLQESSGWGSGTSEAGKQAPFPPASETTKTQGKPF